MCNVHCFVCKLPFPIHPVLTTVEIQQKLADCEGEGGNTREAEDRRQTAGNAALCRNVSKPPPLRDAIGCAARSKLCTKSQIQDVRIYREQICSSSIDKNGGRAWYPTDRRWLPVWHSVSLLSSRCQDDQRMGSQDPAAPSKLQAGRNQQESRFLSSQPTARRRGSRCGPHLAVGGELVRSTFRRH